jgi:hypothetical protein
MGGFFSSGKLADLSVSSGLLLLIFTFFACSPEEKILDNGSTHGSKDDSTSIFNAYINASSYYSYDTDSILLDTGAFSDLVASFRTKGTKVTEKEYFENNAHGNFKCFLIKKDTLTIDKYHFGEGGMNMKLEFGNRQYLTSGDSLIIVRKYVYNPGSNGDNALYKISEQIYYFKEGILKEREKAVEPWTDFYFKGIQFKTNNISGDQLYKVFKEELAELKKREKVQY